MGVIVNNEEAKPVKRAIELGYILCGDCHQVNLSSRHYCEHCGGRLEVRKSNSISMAWAWLITACVFGYCYQLNNQR